MPRFFNRIRKQLARDNKFFQYSRYAIGEILLVVIGILIALQVNNWNESSNSEKALRQSLVKLRTDINYDLKTFSELDSIHSIWNEQNQYISENVLTGKLVKLDSINQLSAGRGTFLYLTVKTTSYQEMINTGLLYKLDPKVQSSIDNYYELARFEMEKLNRDLQNFSDAALSAERFPYLNYGARLATRQNLNNTDWSWIQDPNSAMYKDLETITMWYSEQIKAYNSVLNKLKIRGTEAISVIDNYLAL
jgi:hypothetical protein